MTDQVPELRAQLYKWRLIKEKWQEIDKYAQAQIDYRYNLIVRDPELTIDKIHYMRGECAGIDLFQRMPDIEIERLENEIKIIQQREEDNDENNLSDTHLAP